MSGFTSYKNKISFTGTGGKLFGIMIVNVLLTIVTLGIYSFWGKAAVMRYLYSKSNFNGSEFEFHGLGKELFYGFLRLIAIILPIYGVMAFGVAIKSNIMATIGAIILYGAFLLLIPLSIHGRMKYRMSKTSWRGIRFGYRGDLKELTILCIKGILLSLVTLGIYSSFFTVNLRKYIYAHTRFGNVSFRYDGKGKDLLIINIKGVIFTVLTLGIYTFWYYKNNFNYLYGNLVIVQDGVESPILTDATAGKFFKLMFVNAIIYVFTLGIGFPWIIIRNINFVFDNIMISDKFEADKIIQTEDDYKNALGEDMSSSFDFNFDIGIL